MLRKKWIYQKTLCVVVSVIHTWVNSMASRCGCELYPVMLISAGFVPTPTRRRLLMRDEETRLWSATPSPCCREGCRFEARCWHTGQRSAWTWWTCQPPGCDRECLVLKKREDSEWFPLNLKWANLCVVFRKNLHLIKSFLSVSESWMFYFLSLSHIILVSSKNRLVLRISQNIRNYKVLETRLLNY